MAQSMFQTLLKLEGSEKCENHIQIHNIVYSGQPLLMLKKYVEKFMKVSCPH